MSKVTHVIVELDNPTDSKWLRYGISDEYYGEGKPLIMCKDCKHYYRFDGRCYLWSINRRENGYCDRAERKGE